MGLLRLALERQDMIQRKPVSPSRPSPFKHARGHKFCLTKATWRHKATAVKQPEQRCSMSKVTHDPRAWRSQTCIMFTSWDCH